MIRREGLMRAFFIKGRPVGRIIFYSNGTKHADLQEGWLIHYHTKDTTKEVISLPFDPQKAYSEDLNRQNHYYISPQKIGLETLYIHCEPCFLGKFAMSPLDCRLIQYKTFARFNIPCLLEGNEQSKDLTVCIGTSWESSEEIKKFHVLLEDC